MELLKVDHPKPSFSEIREILKMASEVDCANCKANLKRIYRFRNLRYPVTLLLLIICSMALLVFVNSYLAMRILLPLVLLSLAGRIWDDTYPRLQLRKHPES